MGACPAMGRLRSSRGGTSEGDRASARPRDAGGFRATRCRFGGEVAPAYPCSRRALNPSIGGFGNAGGNGRQSHLVALGGIGSPDGASVTLTVARRRGESYG